MLERYQRVVPTGQGAGGWYRQENYRARFVSGPHALRPDDVRDVLLQRHHIAVRARPDKRTDRIAFDIDCKDESGLERRTAHYWAIRRLMGIERVPLVYRTPSGRGLRIVYRVPEMPLERLVTGRRTGLVADVLRAAGLPVRDGEIEIFPQQHQGDRLPLGSGMPILDPATLEPLPEAAIGETYDVAMLSGGITALERWHAAPYADLVDHLASLPGQPLPQIASVERSARPTDFVRAGVHVAPSVTTRLLVQQGLTAPSTRYHSEWLVGLAIIIAPEIFGEFGTPAAPDDDAVAGTLANWLAERHNGHSGEWATSLRANRSTERAVATWTARYLKRSSTTGEHLIDRLRRTVQALDPSLRQTLLLTDEERRAIIRLAERAKLKGSALYRAEVWLAASRRAAKSIIRYHARNGMALQERRLRRRPAIVIPIAARWMQKWPYGKGALAYGRYRQILIDAGWMQLERYSPTAEAYRRGVRLPDDIAREASTYAVRMPDLEVRVGDVGVDALQLQRVLKAQPIRMSGRDVGVDEAHHALWLARTGVPVRKRYGYRLGVRLQEIAAELEQWLGAGAP